jgi:hypothetical protein
MPRFARSSFLNLFNVDVAPDICGWIEDALHLSKAKCKSASWTIIAIRIDNQLALEGTVSRLPLSLLPNGPRRVRYEPHLSE